MLEKKRYSILHYPYNHPDIQEMCVLGEGRLLQFSSVWLLPALPAAQRDKKEKVLLKYFLQKFGDNVLYVPNLLAELPDLPQPEPWLHSEPLSSVLLIRFPMCKGLAVCTDQEEEPSVI